MTRHEAVRVAGGNKAALWTALLPDVVNVRTQYAFEELWEGIYG